MQITVNLIKYLVALLFFVFVFGNYASLQAQLNTKSSPSAENNIPEAGEEAEKKTKVQEKNADYWYEKGILVSVYGNHKAAIQFFQKVIELDPQRSDAYFQLGVSYGELGDHQTAASRVRETVVT